MFCRSTRGGDAGGIRRRPRRYRPPQSLTGTPELEPAPLEPPSPTRRHPRSWWSYQRSRVQPRARCNWRRRKLAVRAGSRRKRILQRLKSTVAPALQWVETAPSSADPVEDVDSGGAGLRHHRRAGISFAHHLVPERAGWALRLPEERPVQWLVRHGRADLLASVNGFLSRPRGPRAPLARAGTAVLRRTRAAFALRGIARVPEARR